MRAASEYEFAGRKGSAAIGLVIAALVVDATLGTSPVAARRSADTANLRDWTLARCLTKAAGDQPLAADARRSAAALLERGSAGSPDYERIDALIVRTLAVPTSGSTGGTYAVLQCIDLARGRALGGIIARRR